MTVNEAALHCQNFGLSRTRKTVRSWAKNGHVMARKQTTAHGEMWVLEVEELTAKIKAELEFAEQSRKGSEASEPVHTSANPSEPVQARSHPSEPVRKEPEEDENPVAESKIRSLESQIQTLTIDIRWRDQMLDKLNRDNERMFDSLQGQARYIGHLETDLLRLGGQPDQKFLSAPTARQDDATKADRVIEPETANRPHPEQQNFMTG